jgi:hypothetical protein
LTLVHSIYGMHLTARSALLYASISSLSFVDAVTLFCKNGTTGDAAYEAFRNPSALGVAGALVEALPFARAFSATPSASIGGAKAAFTVPTKALDIFPEGPLLSIKKCKKSMF